MSLSCAIRNPGDDDRARDPLRLDRRRAGNSSCGVPGPTPVSRAIAAVDALSPNTSERVVRVDLDDPQFVRGGSMESQSTAHRDVRVLVQDDGSIVTGGLARALEQQGYLVTHIEDLDTAQTRA